MIDLVVNEKYISDDLLLRTLRHLESIRDAISPDDILKLTHALPLQMREPFFHTLLEKARKKELSDLALLKLVNSLLNVMGEKGVAVRNPAIDIILEKLAYNMASAKTVCV